MISKNIQQRIHHVQRNKSEIVIHRSVKKFYSQYPFNKTRKTRFFDLYIEKELDFPDDRNLLQKKLQEFEFDNDVDSDEDEIAKSAYIRLKDLTISLKEKLNKENLIDNDPDDVCIKETVGYKDEDYY